MPSGGARVRSGPAPDPNALQRERDFGDWTLLPSTGRPGPPPDWPLMPNPTKRELEIWARLWAKPQAIKWEELGQDHEVALYVRRLIAAEKRNAPVTAVTVVRQLADSLGLTTGGLNRNRWRIARPQVAGAGVVDETEPMEPSRSRLRVVGADVMEGA